MGNFLRNTPNQITFLFILVLLLWHNRQVEAQSFNAYNGSGFAFSFNGTNHYIQLGQNNRGITNQVTIEAWIRTSSPEYRWVAGKYSNTQGEDGGFHLIINNGAASFNGRDGSGNYRSSGASTTLVADGRWHHLTGVCNNGRWEIYVDGVLENSLSTNNFNTRLNTVQAYFTLGDYHEFNSNYFQGLMDEVRIWKSARTEKEIRDNMCRKLAGNETNLVGYYNMNDIANNAVVDLSPSKINGQMPPSLAQTISGAPIGDVSRPYYQSSWANTFLELAEGSFHTFQVFNPSASAKGVHLYRVNSIPNTINGLPNNNHPGYYYGVFTVGGPTSSYTVNYKAFGGSNCYTLYKRSDNAQMQWALLPTTNSPTSQTLNKTGETGRGEYILNTSTAPGLSINGRLMVCNGTSTVLEAVSPVAGGTFSWSNGATTSKISVLQPGTYSVKYMLPGGCLTETSAQVTLANLPAFSLGRDTLLCAGGIYTLKAPTTAGLSYLWQNGQTGNSFQVNASGLYWVEIGLNGCTKRDSINITYDPQPVVNLGRDTVLCANGQLVLNAANPGKTFRWQDGSTNSQFNVSRAGTYWVEVKNSSGCITRDEIRVDYESFPLVDLGPDLRLCAGQTVTLNAGNPGMTYKWQDGSSGQTFLVKSAGTYVVDVRSRAGCITQDRVEVSYENYPVVNLGRDTTMCVGKTLELNAGNPGLQYRWQNGTASQTYTVSQPGLYWADVTNTTGCTTRDSIRVVYLTPPVVNLGKDTTLCAGQTLTIQKFLPGVTYLWQDNASGPAYTINKPGKYWLRASLDVCSETDTIVVRYQPLPPVVFSGDTVLCRGNTLLLSAASPGATYQWQDNSTAASFLVSQAGTYAVTIRQNYCTTTSTLQVTYEDCEPFIPNIITPNADGYNEKFQIKKVDSREWQLQIFNRWGKQVYLTQSYQNDWDGQDLSAGTYYYRLTNMRLQKSYQGWLELIR